MLSENTLQKIKQKLGPQAEAEFRELCERVCETQNDAERETEIRGHQITGGSDGEQHGNA